MVRSDRLKITKSTLRHAVRYTCMHGRSLVDNTSEWGDVFFFFFFLATCPTRFDPVHPHERALGV
eukprot:3498191-Prymnesium_polylepis.1